MLPLDTPDKFMVLVSDGIHDVDSFIPISEGEAFDLCGKALYGEGVLTVGKIKVIRQGVDSGDGLGPEYYPGEFSPEWIMKTRYKNGVVAVRLLRWRFEVFSQLVADIRAGAVRVEIRDVDWAAIQ